MNNFEEKQTEKTATEAAAVSEGKIKAEDLMQELLPLICECFWGRMSIADSLGYTVFLNGQKFKLTIKEVE